MKKPSATNPLLKIGQAAKALGVSIDTLRRWEKAGKISTIRTPGGTRLYSLAALRKINPSASWRIADFQAKSFSTEELLKRAGLASEDKTIETVIARSEATWQSSAEDPSLIAQDDRLRGFKQTLLIKLLIGSAAFLTLTLLLTSWITASYLTNPKETQQFFKNNVAQGLLTPFHKLAEVAVAEISPEKAQELGFSKTSEVSLSTLSTSDVAMGKVLAVTSVPKFLEVNSDTQINGSLSVRDSINNLTVEATPSASTLALTSGDTTLTVTKNALLDQDVSTTATPIFNTLNLSATKDQLVFQSGGPSGTLTWTPTAIRTITLPDTTTTLVGTDATQTLTNKSMSGSSNTFTSIPNSALSNPKVTVTAGTNLTGGGDVSLGSSITLSLISSPAISGVLKLADGTAAAPALTFTNDTNTGLYRIGTDKIGLITGGSATSGITIDGSGNVGVGTITPSYQLQTTGNVGLGGSLTVTSATSLNSSVSLTGLGAGSGNALCVNSSNAVVTCTVGSGGISGSGFSGGVSFFDSTSSITATPNLYWDNTNSRLGIGTSSPDYSFKVNGTGFFSGFVGIGSSMNVSGNVGIGGSLTVTGLSSLSSVTASSLTTAAFKLTTGAGNNYILVSDESGSGSWSGTISGSLITDNSLDFDKFKDNMTLDASTDIATAGYNLTTSGIGALAFNNTGTFTVAGATTFNSTINTNTFTSTALVFSGSGNVGISATVASTNLNLNPGAGGSVNLAGGSGSTGCTIDDTTGSLTCSGSIGVGSSGGQNGLWSRDGTTLSPAYTGDSISTSGNISAIGNGAITSGGVLTAQNGLTLSTGALSLTSTSGTAALNLSLVTNAFTVNGNTFGIDVFNSRVGIGTSSPIAQLDIRNAGSGTNLHTYIGSSAGQFGILDNGNVGIGTTNPGSSLQVSGNGIFGWGTTSIAGPSNGLGISGNVGIGTTTTLAPLHVQGNGTNSALFLNGNVGIGFTSPDRKLQIGSDIDVTSTVVSLLGANGTQFSITGSTAANLQKKLTLGIDTTDNFGVIQAGNTSGTAYPLIFNPAGGNVGIGTTVISSTIDAQVGQSSDDAYWTSDGGWNHVSEVQAGPVSKTAGMYARWGYRFTGITIPDGATITVAYLTFTTDNYAPYNATVSNADLTAEKTASPATYSTKADFEARTLTTAVVAWDGIETWPTQNVEHNSASIVALINELMGSYSYAAGAPMAFQSNGTRADINASRNGYSWNGDSSKAPKLHIEYTITKPMATLAISGNAVIGSPFFGASAPSNGLAVSGNVGIGITTANSTLSIAGNTHIGSLYQGTVAPTNGLFVDGNVGIGATTSSNKLDVWGNSRLAGTLTVDSTSIFGGNLTLSSGQFLAPNGSASLPSYSFTNSTSTGMYSPSVNALSLVTNGASTPALTITAGGNVGIGTTVPGSTLSVIGNVGIGTSAAGATLQVNGGGLFGWGTVSVAGPTNGLAVFGNVGIGTTTANSNLSVVGNAHVGGLYQSISAPTNGLFVDGNVGIGATTSTNKLDVWGNQRITGTLTVDQTASFGGNFTLSSGQFLAPNGTASLPSYSFSNLTNAGLWTNGDGLLLTTGGSNTSGITVTGAGYVGIGTTSPTFQLQTTGNVGIGGSLTVSSGLSLPAGSILNSYLANSSINVTATSGTGLSVSGSPVSLGGTLTVAGIDASTTVKGVASFNSTNFSVSSGAVNTSQDIATSATPGFVGLNTTSGNVGIGTSATSSRLAVNGNSVIGWGTTAIAGPSNGLAVSGNVGIGTTSPNYKLDVIGQVNGSTGLCIAGDCKSAWSGVGGYTASNGLTLSGVDFQLGGSLTRATGIDINSQNFGFLGGNVGIGITNPGSKLTVIGNVGIGTSATGANLQINGGAAIGFNTAAVSSFSNNGLIVNGNVGIGTSSPTALLDVNGAVYVANTGIAFRSDTNTGFRRSAEDFITFFGNGQNTLGVDGSSGVGRLVVGNGTPVSRIQMNDDNNNAASGITFGGTASTYIQMYKSGSNQLAIMGGNVGIGTTNPTATLQVQGNVGIGYTSVAIPAGGLAVFGNVGIGTTTANSNLSVVGNAHIGSLYQGISAPANGLFVDGNVGIGATTSSNKLDVWGNTRLAGTLTVDSTGTLGAGLIGYSGVTAPASGLAISGNLGIGTTTANYNLSVVGTTNITDNLSLGSQLLAANGSASLPSYSFTNLTNAGLWTNGDGLLLTTGGSNTKGITVTGAGNVGIGTTNPSQKLEVNGNLELGTGAQVQSDVDNSFIYLLGGNSINAAGIALSGKDRTTDQGAIKMYTTNAAGSRVERFSITGAADTANAYFSNSNVGIGFTSPDRLLQIGSDINITPTVASLLGANGSQLSITGSTAANLQKKLTLGIDTTDNYGVIQAGNADGTAYNLALNPGGGNVGIGTTTPQAKLHLEGSSAGAMLYVQNTTGGGFQMYSYDTNGGLRFRTWSGTTVDVTDRMVITTGGNVGIGDATADALLDVKGTVCLDLNADEACTDNTSAISDARLKTNITNFTDGLELIGQLRPVRFTWNGEYNTGTGNSLGFLAQELETIFPELVITDTAGYKNLDYGKLTAVLTSAIQEQQGQIVNLQTNLATTSARLDATIESQRAQLVSQGLSLSTQGETLNRLSGALSVSGGNVGIGTTSPTSALDVVGNVNVSGTVKTPLLDLGPATIASSAGNLAIQFSADTTLFQIKNSLGQNLFQIDASGSAKLSGTITTAAGAFDVAEDYNVADGSVEAGDVVSLSSVIPRSEATSESLLTKIATATPDGGPRNDESAVEKSSKPYDNSIIGIISTKPGIHLSAKTSEVSQSTSEVGTNQTRPVALNGRVLVKVSTENGAINVGDYLTSSSTPGVTMKATRPGQVIGKALEAFPTDTSEVKKCDYTSEVDCGKIVVFINISFADPGNFLASLSLDDQGNMIIPKIRTSSLLLDPSVASASSQQLTANSQQLALDTDPNYTSPGPSLATGSNQYIDLSGKIASLEERITELENKLASQGDALETQEATPSAQIAGEATSSATASIQVTGDSGQQESTSSANLNLTPPDILLATGSATLANLKVTSEATVSGMLTAYQTQIQDNFKVLGKTTLADTLIAGELMVDGILSLTGSSLSTLGPLYIQNSSLAQGVDIFNGKVTIDPGGNITTQGKIIATEVKTNKLTISNTPVASSSATLAASIGTATLPNGSSAVTIDSAEISDSAKVFITPTSPTDKILSVVNIKPGENFDVATLTPAQADIKFNWWIVESR